MHYEIQNITRRLVSIHCNSGKTCHLPPGEKFELAEQEINGNPAIKKLQDRKCIRTRELATQEAGKSAAGKKAKAEAS